MIKLTEGEVKLHQIRLKQIRDRLERAKVKFANEDITLKKLKSIKKEVAEEEVTYLRETGIIYYFGSLFKVTA